MIRRAPLAVLLPVLALLVAVPTFMPLRAEEPVAVAPLLRTSAELQELVGPVALYPDVVLASLLPATAYPAQLNEAAAWVRAQPQGRVVEAPLGVGWDENVKALLQFPDLVLWLDANPEWTESLGVAMSAQPNDVLAAVQAFRFAAQQAGNLATNERLRVSVQSAPPTIVDGWVGAPDVRAPIVIEPVDPYVVYLPTYDPVVVIVRQPRPVITFGIGFSFGHGGFWLRNEVWWPWWRSGTWHHGGLWWHQDPWYWGSPRPSSWAYATPYAWRGPTHAYRSPYGYGTSSRVRGGGSVRTSGVRRPTAPVWTNQTQPRVVQPNVRVRPSAVPSRTTGLPRMGPTFPRVPGSVQQPGQPRTLPPQTGPRRVDPRARDVPQRPVPGTLPPQGVPQAPRVVPRALPPRIDPTQPRLNLPSTPRNLLVPRPPQEGMRGRSSLAPGRAQLPNVQAPGPQAPRTRVPNLQPPAPRVYPRALPQPRPRTNVFDAPAAQPRRSLEIERGRRSLGPQRRARPQDDPPRQQPGMR